MKSVTVINQSPPPEGSNFNLVYDAADGLDAFDHPLGIGLEGGPRPRELA